MGKTFAEPNGELESGLQIEESDRAMRELPADDAFGLQPEAVPVEPERGFQVIDADLITAFLRHLETERANTTATRNARLAAIRSLFRYAALHAPEHAEDISRVLAIPPKRCDRSVVTYLT